jgi:hypothetical protein
MCFRIDYFLESNTNAMIFNVIKKTIKKINFIEIWPVILILLLVEIDYKTKEKQ